MNKNLPAILGGEPVFKKGLPPYNTIGEEEKKAVMRVMDSGVLGSFVARKGEYFLGGKEVLSFEKKFSRMFGVPYAISNNSATAALHMAVAALDIGPGDEVIVSPFTMSATASAILMHNAIPVFSDIEDEFFGLDPSLIEEKITPRTKAIIVVHLFGLPARIDEIMKIARRHKLKVI
ncbi:MAG: DegT/DnrJ/EryC1/StrS family aminotransferase, partial [Candidatus Omnitrophota bacterium]